MPLSNEVASVKAKHSIHNYSGFSLPWRTHGYQQADRLGELDEILKALPIHLQDLIGNSPYCLPYNSYDIGLENLILVQKMIP